MGPLAQFGANGMGNELRVVIVAAIVIVTAAAMAGCVTEDIAIPDSPTPDHPKPGWNYFLVYEIDGGKILSGHAFEASHPYAPPDSGIDNPPAGTSVIQVPGEAYAAVWQDTTLWYVDHGAQEVKRHA